MEILLFFLKVWSIVWSAILVGFTYALLTKSYQSIKSGQGYNFNFKLNLKTCFEITLYVTSIYSWFA